MDSPTSEVVTMDAPVVDPEAAVQWGDWLTRPEIDSIIDAMSAADLIEAVGDGDKLQGAKMAGDAFNAAAARLGVSNGTPATEHVRMQDFVYLAQRIGEAWNVDSPLSEGQSD